MLWSHASRVCLAALSLAFAAPAGLAQARAGGLGEVTVSAQARRAPVEKPYAAVVQGMEMFDRLAPTLAPGAALRFRLLPRRPGDDLAGVELLLLGQQTETRVAVAPDRRFSLPRDARALADGAKVTLLDRDALMATWRVDIRSPGVAQEQRRLGDLRLECEVGLEAGLVSNTRSFLDDIANALTRPGFCQRNPARYYFFADRPLYKVTLVSGTRRHVLPTHELYGGLTRDPLIVQELPYCDCQALLDRTYFLPLGDASWPDDTRVEFEYMDEVTP